MKLKKSGKKIRPAARSPRRHSAISPAEYSIPIRVVPRPMIWRDYGEIARKIEAQQVQSDAKDEAHFSVPLLRIAGVILAVGLSLVGASRLADTSAYFIDREDSKKNIFIAGNLDFSLDAESDEDPVCENGSDPREISLRLTNQGNLFKYAVSSVELEGNLCDYVELEANRNGGDFEYEGLLKDFTYGPAVYSDPEDWIFKLSLPDDLPEGLMGKKCEFTFSFLGSQTRNDLPFPEGFNDLEEISGALRAPYCRDGETRTIGYWKNHEEDYLPHLNPPIYLGNYPNDLEIDSESDVKSIFKKDDLSMRNKLLAQLLALKFNIAHFRIGSYVPEGEEKNLDELVAAADALLRKHSPTATNDELEEMKDLFDSVNNLHAIRICACEEEDIEMAADPKVKDEDEDDSKKNRKPAVPIVPAVIPAEEAEDTGTPPETETEDAEDSSAEGGDPPAGGEPQGETETVPEVLQEEPLPVVEKPAEAPVAEVPAVTVNKEAPKAEPPAEVIAEPAAADPDEESLN